MEPIHLEIESSDWKWEHAEWEFAVITDAAHRLILLLNAYAKPLLLAPAQKDRKGICQNHTWKTEWRPAA